MLNLSKFTETVLQHYRPIESVPQHYHQILVVVVVNIEDILVLLI